jgi:transcriptional antiterminator RfaH
MAGLGVEVYSPTKIEMKQRKDCKGFRPKEIQLFPGYLFLRFDPAVVHTSIIGDSPGVRDFVRFGDKISTVSNALVESLKQSLLFKADHKVTHLETRNVPAKTMARLESIALMTSKTARQAAYYALLREDAIQQNATRTDSRVCGITGKSLPVKQKLN